VYSEQEMKKLEALKVGGVQREGRKKKTPRFVSWKAYFFFLLFFHYYSFSFALQR
jgi:hypothetical protein